MAASTKSYTKYELSGTAQSQFPFDFPYFNVSDITVELPPDYTGTYTINASTNTVELSSPISVGTVRIRRHTPQAVKHIFANMMRFNFKAVDENFTRCLYWFQEARDAAELTGAAEVAADLASVRAAVTTVSTTLTAVETSTSRALKLPAGSAVSTTVPAADAGKLLGWDSAAGALANIDQSAENTTAVDPGGRWSVVQGFITYLLSKAGSALVGFVHNTTAATFRTVQERLRDTVSVKDFGAVGDGVADDTAAFKAAIAYACSAFRAVWIPCGIYKITDTLDLTGGNFYGASLLGESRAGVKLISYVSDTKAVLQATGGSGTSSNVHICDLTIAPSVPYEGCAIRVDGQDLVVVERLNIDTFKYGIWLHNNSAGAFTELCAFRDCWVSYCDNGIRIEQGAGNSSFHGCVFDGVFMNVGSARNQIGINHVSGHYYNGNFKFHIWTDGPNSQVLRHNGNAELNTGSIQIESSAQPGFINGTGSWNYNGELLASGSVTINSPVSNGQPMFACDNAASNSGEMTYSATGFLPASTRVSPLPQGFAYKTNGIHPAVLKISGASNQDSVGVVVYNGSSVNNGLYVFDNGYHGAIGSLRPLWKLGADGAYSYSYTVASATGTVYQSINSRSNKGAGDGTYANDDAFIQVRRANKSFAADVYTHDAEYVFGTNNSVRDGAPVERVAIGSIGLYPWTDNTYSCGDGTHRWSAIYAVNGAIQTSDARQKTDVAPSALGLDFINHLRPVSYKWIVGGKEVTKVEDGEEVYQEAVNTVAEDGTVSVNQETRTRKKYRDVITKVPGKRTHWGFLSQEVKAAADSAGVDFGGWIKVDLQDPDSAEGLRYDQLIAPVVKAVQELSAQVLALQQELAQLRDCNQRS